MQSASLLAGCLLFPRLKVNLEFQRSIFFLLFSEFGPFHTVDCCRACACVHRCVFVGVRGQHGVPSSISLRLIVWDRASQWTSLASELQRSYSYLLHTGIDHCGRLFTWVLGIQTWLFTLAWQALYWPNHLPSPLLSPSSVTLPFSVFICVYASFLFFIFCEVFLFVYFPAPSSTPVLDFLILFCLHYELSQSSALLFYALLINFFILSTLYYHLCICVLIIITETRACKRPPPAIPPRQSLAISVSAGFELMVFLPQPAHYWDDRCVPRCRHDFIFKTLLVLIFCC